MLQAKQIINLRTSTIKLIEPYKEFWLVNKCSIKGAVTDKTVYRIKTVVLEQEAKNNVDFSPKRKSQIKKQVGKYIRHINKALKQRISFDFVNKINESRCYFMTGHIEFGIDFLCVNFDKGFEDYTNEYIEGQTIHDYLWSGVEDCSKNNSIKMAIAHEYAHALDFILDNSKKLEHDETWAGLTKDIWLLLQDID